MIKSIFSIVLTFSILISYSQGSEIKVKIKNLKNKEVILGHHFSDQFIPDDTITLNNKGIGILKTNEAHPGGMYFLFLPNKQMFDFILDKDQTFTIVGDTSNFTETVSFEGSSENNFFQNYNKKLRATRISQEKLYKELEANKGDDKKTKDIKAEIAKLTDAMNLFHEKTIEQNPDMFFTKFLIATRRPEVPKTITDKQEQYFWFRHHYFNNFDVSDPRLLRTPIYKNTIDTYIDKVLMQHPDTLIPEIDILIEKSRTNHELFRFMLVHLFKKYAASQIMTSENVYVHIADKYYIKESDWSDKKYINDLKIKVSHKKKCLIGNTAYNINYSLAPNDTIGLRNLITKNDEVKAKGVLIEKSEADSITKYSLKIEVLQDYFNEFTEKEALQNVRADYTILWFWTPSCSHCKKATPKFYEMYLEKQMKSKKVEVISIYSNKDITDWKKFSKDSKDWLKFLKKHKFKEWTNVWNPFDRYKVNYNIESSPVLYLLGKDKKIIAKKIGYEQAFEIIENEIKMKEGK